MEIKSATVIERLNLDWLMGNRVLKKKATKNPKKTSAVRDLSYFWVCGSCSWIAKTDGRVLKTLTFRNYKRGSQTEVKKKFKVILVQRPFFKVVVCNIRRVLSFFYHNYFFTCVKNGDSIKSSFTFKWNRKSRYSLKVFLVYRSDKITLCVHLLTISNNMSLEVNF